MPNKIEFSVAAMKEASEIMSRYPTERKKSALLPILHLAQAEFGGYLSREVMDYVAGILEIKSIEVYEVATFYTMFHLEKTGNFVLDVCRTGPCCLVGAEKIVEHLEKKLGIKAGETTADGLFTIREVECLASCGTAPMMQVGEQYHEHLTAEKVDELIETLKESAKGAKK